MFASLDSISVPFDSLDWMAAKDDRVFDRELIDLISSSDEDSSDDDCISKIIRENFPELVTPQSPEREEKQSRKGRDPHRTTPGLARKTKRQAASAAASDEETFHHELRSLEFLKNHCWACQLWIHHPGFENNQNEDEICCNALHLHPVFNVPVCVVCAETIEAVERKIRPNRIASKDDEAKEDDREDRLTACNACGKIQDEEEDYVRCGVCPRAVCPNCFEQAHHSIGGA